MLQLMDDLRSADVDFMTIGQYLQPTKKHHPVDPLRDAGRVQGLSRPPPMPRASCWSPRRPLTRSSHHAGEDFAQAEGGSSGEARLTLSRFWTQHAAHTGHRQPGRGQEHPGEPHRRAPRPAADSSRPRVFRARLGRAVQGRNGGSGWGRSLPGPSWVMDGNYASTFDIRVPRATAIVWLDLPRWQCLAARAVAGRQELRPGQARSRPGLHRALRLVLHALDLVLSAEDAAEDRPHAAAPAARPARLRPALPVGDRGPRGRIVQPSERPPDRCRPFAPPGP